MAGTWKFFRSMALVLFVGWLFATTALAAEQNRVLGPDGGDVRSLTYVPDNPDRIFLGTSSGRLYVSDDRGRTWEKFAHLGEGFDYVLDHVVIDPKDTKVMFVAAWSIERNTGELFRSKDGGRSWTSLKDMRGKSIRSFTMSPSHSRVMVAGALDGVFRSNDGGDHWQRISPEGHADIHNIESVAIDSHNDDAIYAGTWHLAWKTDDGGQNWHQINKGMIDDSDVFSIIVDPNDPKVVYASACSGIYKSEAAGELFHKIQGIPFSSRRTRVLKQDPNHSNIVYAGTTEGLWRTIDSGKTWKRVSAANLIINDVMVSPTDSNYILLATDRSGVLVSTNNASTFTASNRGFSHRLVSSVLVDRKNPNFVYAGVLNDKEFGGVFVSPDAGQHWAQMSTGLGGHDVFSIHQDANANLYVGTNDGLFRYSPKSHLWMKMPVLRQANLRVPEFSVEGKTWFAATSAGLFRSKNAGAIWTAVPGMREAFLGVAANGNRMAAVTSTKLFESKDGGASWKQISAPNVSYMAGMTVDSQGQILVNTAQGIYRQEGENWAHVTELGDKKIPSLAFDRQANALVAVTAGGVELSSDGRKWHEVPNFGVPLRDVTFASGRMFAGTAFDGVMAVSMDEKHMPSVRNAVAGE